MPERVRIPIPLNGNQKISESYIRRKIESLKNITVSKPGRVLGAVYTSEKVAQGRPVLMCEECVRKYRGWWRQENYKADWGWKYVGDCDGCGMQNLFITLFLPELDFYCSLGPQHGRMSQPGGLR